MSGLRIFQHSVRMLFNNIPNAIKVSLPLLVVMLAVILFGSDTLLIADSDGEAMPNYSSTDLLLSVLWGVAGLWVVVSWHRFVLLEEYPGTFPAFHGPQILVYFLKSLMIGLAIGIPFALALGLLAAILPVLSVLMVLVALPVAVMVFYRLSPLLAAAALGQPMSISEAWQATEGMGISTLIAALLTFFLAAALQVAGALIYAVIPVVGVLGVIAANWAVTLVAASMITTIYGVSVEKRSI